MSVYSTLEHNGYPHHPHPQIHQHVQQSHDQPSAHHGMPIHQNYQYVQPPQQHPQQVYSNGHAEQQPSTPAPANAMSDAPKGNRLRKACDSCSIRKVKCDEAGPPCKACASLEIPCTFNRASRRRGPPNRHAEEIKEKERQKRQKLEESGSPSIAGLSSPTSPSNVAATLASFSSHVHLNAESICPRNILELLVDDFFTYIHPLCPFPHEPSFRAAFNANEDHKNQPFLALLASMVGVLVASFPRRPRLHLKNMGREQLFPNSISLVERCHSIAVQARGSGYLDKDMTVYDACTSYFLGLTGAYTFQWKQCRLYFGETLNISRVLGAHKGGDGLLGVGADGRGQAQQPVDYIKLEVSRRLFWIMFVGVRSMQQLGATFAELLVPPPTPSEPYPPLPRAVDDEYIFHDHIEQQPEGVISKLEGFNLNVKVFQTLTPLSTMEMAYGIDQVFDWQRQKRVLEDALRNVKGALLSTPPELTLQANSQSSQYEPHHYHPLTDYPGARAGHEAPWGHQARRELQYEIQKANIYASQLGTRSHIIEKYWNLHEAHERMKASSSGPTMGSPGLLAGGLDGMLPTSTSSYDGIETIVAGERELIVKDLLRVLGSISQVSMEPNAGSFVSSTIAIYKRFLTLQINKIRQIASTLIETPQNRKGPLALKSEDYLAKFVDVLMKLERISPGLRSHSVDGAVDEEEELRNWADLRENQMRFAQSGGFLFD